MIKQPANILVEILHHYSLLQPGGIVLEAGCGIGAQAKIIAGKNPETLFIPTDLSAAKSTLI